MRIKYIRTENGIIGDKDLPVVVKVLKSIEKDMGVITPKSVVSRAMIPDCPLHKYFEWDDTEAAARYREQQARQLIRSVSVVFKDSEGQEQSVRAFVNLKPDEEDGNNPLSDSSYLSVHEVAKNTSYQNQVVQYAYDQILGWKKRFGHFKEFIRVKEEIEKVKI